MKGSGPNGEYQKVQAMTESLVPNDVTIRVTYDIEGRTLEALHKLSVRKPSAVFMHRGPYSERAPFDLYNLYYIMGVKDQFGALIRYDGIPIQEERSKFCSNQPKLWNRVPLESRDAQTGKHGAFRDYLALPWRPGWRSDFVGKVIQYVKAGGWPAGTFCQTYYRTTAESQPNTCGPCPP
jgi:hypothetical protein